jgi:hypothetical protein
MVAMHSQQAVIQPIVCRFSGTGKINGLAPCQEFDLLPLCSRDGANRCQVKRFFDRR